MSTASEFYFSGLVDNLVNGPGKIHNLLSLCKVGILFVEN
jgi:hypothetical protein